MERFVKKLHNGAHLDHADESMIGALMQPVRHAAAGTDIVIEGSHTTALPLILDGWAFRYRLLPNGKRQIVALLIPGDLTEPFGVLPQFMDYAIGALTPVTYVPVTVEAINAAATARPRISEALWWDLLVTSAIEREHIVSLGRRTALERVGHLLCELHVRLRMVELVDGLTFDFPVTQADLSDLLGLSAVHINRSVQELRKLKLISMRSRSVTIHNLVELHELSLFDQSYLHLSESVMTSSRR